jgi:hypothetical protein
LSLITVFFTHLGILNLTTADNFLAVAIYVGYRNQHPDKETVERVQKKLKENKIDVTELVKYRTDHCQKTESPTKKEVPHRDTGLGI